MSSPELAMNVFVARRNFVGSGGVIDGCFYDRVRMSAPEPSPVVMLSGRAFVAACAVAAVVLLGVARGAALPVSLLAAEVFLTILGLFVFGSFKYQIHKN